MRMKVVAFGTILSTKMNTPLLDAFVHQHVFSCLSLTCNPTQAILTTSQTVALSAFH
jgi:hypothetical protein